MNGFMQNISIIASVLALPSALYALASFTTMMEDGSLRLCRKEISHHALYPLVLDVDAPV